MYNVNNAKYIVVRWMPEDNPYEMGLYVVDSTHPELPAGARADPLGIVADFALSDGYVITVLPALE